MEKNDFPMEKKYEVWKKRKPYDYGKNKVRMTVTQIKPLAPMFRLAYPGEWEAWKRRRCDAGFEVGDKIIVEEGKKVESGEIYCFSAINSTILWIWGVTYDSWFPWNNRLKGAISVRQNKQDIHSVETMYWGCPDFNNTVTFEFKKIEQ
jgi:uncharacterized repeat protein (TIGR04076 family)